MDLKRNSKSKWLWAIALTTMMSLSGCSMYPSKPGAWPGGFWGSILHSVSNLIDFFAKLVGNDYGLALLIVTILVRLLILPFMVKQLRYTKAIQDLQPEMSRIKAQYKGDNKKIQEETMKLYQRTGVNPMSGCFPTLIQLPVLYALFGAIEGNVALSHSTFLGIFHLGQPDHTYILPLLSALTTYLSSKMTMPGNDSQQKIMLIMMPIFIFFISTRFPAGLALYWTYGNIFVAIQTYFFRVRPARVAGNGPSIGPNTGQGSGGGSKSGGNKKGSNSKGNSPKVNSKPNSKQNSKESSKENSKENSKDNSVSEKGSSE